MKKKLFKAVGKICKTPAPTPTDTIALWAAAGGIKTTHISKHKAKYMKVLSRLAIHIAPVEKQCMIMYLKAILWWHTQNEDSIDTVIFLTFGVSWYFGISPLVLNVLVALVWSRPVIVIFILPFSLPMNSRVLAKTGKRLAQHTHNLQHPHPAMPLSRWGFVVTNTARRWFNRLVTKLKSFTSRSLVQVCFTEVQTRHWRKPDEFDYFFVLHLHHIKLYNPMLRYQRLSRLNFSL